ncbi:PAS domain-containing sensor histidine kinase [Actinocorallia libanotica]|uniref:histidine kinase n=1 Tax=Actinocorallia libanotica TaxID=46162 RepID=A0ABN1RRA1_9ACTN
MEDREIDYMAVFRDGPSPAALIDGDLVVVAANDAFLASAGRRAEEVVGRFLLDLFPDDPTDPDSHSARALRCSLERALKSGERDVVALLKYNLEVPGRPGEFAERYWSEVAAPVFGPDGKPKYVIHQVEEVTAFLQRLRQARRVAGTRTRAELEAMESHIYARSRELQEFNERLQQAHERQRRIAASLQEAVERQRRFVSDVSHDLRSPLTGLQLRLEEALSDPDADAKEVLHSVLRDAQRLNDLVCDLLELAHLDARKSSPFETVDLGVQLEEELKRHAFEHQVLSCSGPGVTVNASRIRLSRLLANLLTNADRHCTRQVQVLVEARDSEAVLEVVDDGNGVPESERERIFERFYRAEEARRKDPGGTGLGLSIAREIAEAHGGRLYVDEGPSGGARFVLRLPLAQPLSGTTADS